MVNKMKLTNKEIELTTMICIEFLFRESKKNNWPYKDSSKLRREILNVVYNYCTKTKTAVTKEIIKKYVSSCLFQDFKGLNYKWLFENLLEEEQAA